MTPTRPDLETIIATLAAPGALPGSAGKPVEVIQTHISVVFLTAERAYKLKKPVDFGFLDFSTPEKRARACRDEFRLNCRMAAEWYLGLAPVWFREDGTIDVGDPSPNPAPAHELMVVMRRFPEGRMMDRLLAKGEVGAMHVERLARIVAAFHRDAARGPEIERHGTREAAGGLALENFDQTRGFCGSLFDEETHAIMRRRVAAFLETRERIFARRIAEGRVREGHGDLHSPNVCLVGDDPVVYDCIEFSAKYRSLDVASEVAFLAMDLEYRDHSELARVFIDAYVDESEDPALRALLPFYLSYRAMVRAKIAALTWAASEVDADTRARAETEARTLFAMAERYSHGLVPPALVMIGGPTGAGRHTIGAVIERAAGLTVIEAAKVREALSSAAVDESHREAAREAAYSEAMTTATHQALSRQVRERLAAGETALVVANFFEREHREALLEAARSAGLPALYVEVHASDEEIAARLGRRAFEAIPEAQREARRTAEPADEIPAEKRLDLPCPHDPEASAEEVLARLREWGGAP